MPAGVVEAGYSAGTFLFQAKRKVAGKILAFCGAYMEWSLNHEDTSVVPLLGRTGGPHHSPGIRHKIYRHLLDRPDGDTTKAIHASLGLPDYKLGSLQHQIRDLQRLGIVNTETFVDFNPQFILHPEVAHYEHEKERGLRTLSPLRDLIARGLQALYTKTAAEREGKATAGSPIVHTLNDLLVMCKTLDPDVDLAAARRVFTTGKPNDPDSLKGREIVRDPDYVPEKRRITTLYPELVRPITDLRARFDALATKEGVEHYQDVALSIVGQPGVTSEAFHALMAKGLRFSVHGAVRRGETPLREQVLDAVLALRKATIEEITANLDTADRKINKVTIRECLAELTKKGLLVREHDQPDPTKRLKLSYYSVLQPDTSEETP